MKPTIKEVREALLAEAKSTEEMVAGAESGVRYTAEYLRALAVKRWQYRTRVNKENAN